jgi:hypothetical protein
VSLDAQQQVVIGFVDVDGSQAVNLVIARLPFNERGNLLPTVKGVTMIDGVVQQLTMSI